MKPILFSLGPIHFYSFGLMIILGCAISLYWMEFKADREGFLERRDVFPLFFITVTSGFVGARLAFIIQNYKWFLQHPHRFAAIWEGGLIFYGGLAASFLAVRIFAWVKKVSFRKLGDIVVVYLALIHSFSRIGCFLNGCCGGRPCALPWAVQFPSSVTPVHPTQLYEAVFNFFLFLFLYIRYKKKVFDGQIIPLYFMGYAFGRFMIEFYRHGNPFWLVLTYNQWVSILVFLIAGLTYLRWKNIYLAPNDAK